MHSPFRWRSFLTSGFTSFYLFVYCIHYFLTKLTITGTISTLLYFGYTLIMVFLFFLLTGTVGFFACFWFVRKIYSVVKVDWAFAARWIDLDLNHSIVNARHFPTRFVFIYSFPMWVLILSSVYTRIKAANTLQMSNLSSARKHGSIRETFTTHPPNVSPYRSCLNSTRSTTLMHTFHLVRY